MTTGALPPPAWTERALCAQVDADQWFPEQGGTVLPVKAICRRCPVRVPCLRLALDSNETHGIWGGLSPNERERAAGPYRQGISLPVIIADADAHADACRVAAAQHSRELALKASAAYAARHADQSRERAALWDS